MSDGSFMRFQVVRIRAARESEIGERARLRREVVTYYEGYLDRVWCILLRVMLSTRSLQVGQHCAGLESKLTDHGEKTSAVLVREEVRWYKYRALLGCTGCSGHIGATQKGPQSAVRAD